MWGMDVAIYFTAVVSGAYMNPALTTAQATFLGFEKEKPYLYTAAQLAGTFCCAALVYALCSNLFTDYEIAHGFLHNSEAALSTAGILPTYPCPSLSMLGEFSVEFIITAVLIFAFLALVDESNGPPRAAIPPTLIAAIGGSLGPLTAFSMNPVRDLGPRLFAYFSGSEFALSGARDILYFIVLILGRVSAAGLIRK
ncbi:MAG: glycerol uptake facilitator protein [Psychromonas sp.]|jgi:glycerol uptake facilitator protein